MARVHLLTVIAEEQEDRVVPRTAGVPAMGGSTHKATVERVRPGLAQLSQAAEAYLTQWCQCLRAMGLAVTCEIAIGRPDEQIIAVAAGEPANLIAMASHGYSRLRRWTLGSVADKVAHGAPVPVFLVRGAEPVPAAPEALRRILVPLDGSSLAKQALPHAIDLALHAHAELILLQAVAPVVEAYPYPRLPLGILNLLRDLAQQELNAIAERLRQYPISVAPLATLGYPAQVILDTAQQRDADMIVMATHGAGGLRRWLLGSVADKVLHSSTIPLLLVRAQLEGQERTEADELMRQERATDEPITDQGRAGTDTHPDR
jgi:nucleotide-binding universal stress UspA family protein